MATRIAPDTLPDDAQAPDSFLLGLSQDIWEERKIDAALDYWADDLILRAPDQVLRSNGAAVAATLSQLAEFPDLALLGEDVIWSATKPTDGGGVPGIIAATRQTACATHLGAGRFGAPSGAPVRYTILSETWCARGRLHDVWQIADHGAVLRQLGHSPEDWVTRHLAELPETAPRPTPLTPDNDPEGPYIGTGRKGGSADALAGMLKDVMTGDLTAIARGWDRAAVTHTPGGVIGHGWRAAETFWLGLRSAFPSAAFRIDHRIGQDEPKRPPRAALRWSLYGRHDGWGAFGAPTGAYVYVMGMTQAEFGPRGLHREWTLVDETAIWTQIAMARG